MNELKRKSLLDQADELFLSAKEELCRPEEDVVPYMVCNAAYKSIYKYLSGFLLSHDEHHNSATLDELVKRCGEIDPRFMELDVQPLLRQADDEKVWTNMGTVHQFIDLAAQTRSLVGIG